MPEELQVMLVTEQQNSKQPGWCSKQSAASWAILAILGERTMWGFVVWLEICEVYEVWWRWPTLPHWQLLVGGIGKPRLAKITYRLLVAICMFVQILCPIPSFSDLNFVRPSTPETPYMFVCSKRCWHYQCIQADLGSSSWCNLSFHSCLRLELRLVCLYSTLVRLLSDCKEWVPTFAQVLIAHFATTHSIKFAALKPSRLLPNSHWTGETFSLESQHPWFATSSLQALQAAACLQLISG